LQIFSILVIENRDQGAADAINVMAMHGTGRSQPLANPKPDTGNAETIRPIKPLAEYGYGS
jgi:hypothetical protein